jgi:hypothetical protein
MVYEGRVVFIVTDDTGVLRIVEYNPKSECFHLVTFFECAEFLVCRR